MNSTDLEQLRISLLRFLDANAARSTAFSLLVQYAKSEGRPALTAEIVRAELNYLEGKGLVAKKTKLISPENPAYDITAAGRDAYAEFQK